MAKNGDLELALRIKAEVDTAKNKLDDFTKSVDGVAETAKRANTTWQETAAAQNAAMNAYHKSMQAAEQKAAADAQAAEQAKKTATETAKQMTSLQKLLGTLDKTQKAFADLDKQEQELNNHFKAGRIDIDTYNASLAKIQAKRNVLGNIGNEAKTSTNEVNKLTKAIRGMYGFLATAVTGYGVINLGKSVVDTSMQWDKAKTIMENATGSASKAAKELDFVKEVSKKLNVELLTAATSYSKLVAAAQGSPDLANQVQGMFQGVSEAAAVLKLAPHEVNAILVNYEQMLSKGKVDLTDLKQIANFIPGTMEKAAKGLGTTTTQMTEWISKGLIPASEFLPRFSDELHKAFGESAQQAAQGLQGQLTNLQNTWTELKLEAGNAGFVDSFTDAVKSLTDALKDPAVKEGLNTLISGLGQLSKFTLENFANMASNIRRFAEEAAKLTTGETAADDIKGIMEDIELREKLIESIKQRLARLNSPDYKPTALEAIGQTFTGTTIKDEIKDAEQQLALQEKLLKQGEKLRDLYNESVSPVNTKIENPLDPLVKSYQEAKAKLAEAQKKIEDQIKTGNGQVDSSLTEQKDIYQNKFDEINKLVQDKYDSLTKEQDSQSWKLQELQKQYAENAANLSEEQKIAILGQITQIKSYLTELNSEINKFKPLATLSTPSRPAFVPTTKPKKTTGKSKEQQLAEQNESYVEGLEKQSATLNLGKIATLEYEIAQKKLTGTLLERANAAKQALIDQQNLNNAKVNTGMQVELLRLNGSELQANLLEIQNQFKETTANLQKEGNTAGIAIAKQLFNTQVIKSQLDAVQGQVEKYFSNMRLQEQSIQAQVQAGQITEYEGQKRLTALHKETAATVKKALPDLEKMAQLPGAMGDQARQYLVELNNQLLILETTTSELENAFRNGLQDGIQSSIDGLVKGTMNLQDALQNLLQSIASSILNQAIQDVASQATSGLMSGLKGLGSVFGMGAEDPLSTESNPQALAITTASQQGALAMQTAIEQGGMLAGQAMASALNSVNAMGEMGAVGGEAGLFGDVAAHSQEAVQGIQQVQAAKTAADTTMAASAAAASATTTATTTAAAGSATAAWSAPAALSSIASWGSAAAIGLSAIMIALTAAKSFNTGGDVSGAGTGTSDSIPAWLSNGEFVTRAAVMKQRGAKEFAHLFNRHGMAALDMVRVRHATGGMAGIPAPNMPAPSYSSMKPVDNAGTSGSTTLKNNQNFYLVDDPQKAGNAILKNSHTQQSYILWMQQNNQQIKSALEIG